MTSFKILFSFFSTLDKNILREMLICCTMIIHIFIFPCFSSDQHTAGWDQNRAVSHRNPVTSTPPIPTAAPGGGS